MSTTPPTSTAPPTSSNLVTLTPTPSRPPTPTPPLTTDIAPLLHAASNRTLNPPSETHSDPPQPIEPTFRGVDEDVIVRTRQDYVTLSTHDDSETEGWMTGPFPEVDEVEIQTEELWAIHQSNLKGEIESNGRWAFDPDIRDVNDPTIVMIEKPTASQFKHHVLHPSLYRNIQGLTSLDYFARLVGAPEDWEARYERACQFRPDSIKRTSRLLSQLPRDSPETRIETKLSDAIIAMNTALEQVELQSERENKVVVGGTLAYSQYDVKSQTDLYFTNLAGECVLATEIKTDRSFPEGEIWYKKSRGSLLYIFSSHADNFMIC